MTNGPQRNKVIVQRMIFPLGDLISDALPFGGLWYLEVDDSVEYAKHCSRSHDAVIRVYGEAGNVIEAGEHVGD